MVLLDDTAREQTKHVDRLRVTNRQTWVLNTELNTMNSNKHRNRTKVLVALEKLNWQLCAETPEKLLKTERSSMKQNTGTQIWKRLEADTRKRRLRHYNGLRRRNSGWRQGSVEGCPGCKNDGV